MTITSSPVTGGRAADDGKPLVSLAVEYQRVAWASSSATGCGSTSRGENFDVTVASFRSVKWDSFRPNFFVVFPPGLLDASCGHLYDQRLSAPSGRRMAQLVQRFPERLDLQCRRSAGAGPCGDRQGGDGGAERVCIYAAGGSDGAAGCRCRPAARSGCHEIAILRVLGAQPRMISGQRAGGVRAARRGRGSAGRERRVARWRVAGAHSGSELPLRCRPVEHRRRGRGW